MPVKHPRYTIATGLFRFSVDQHVIGFNPDHPGEDKFYLTTECGGFYFTEEQLNELAKLEDLTTDVTEVAGLKVRKLDDGDVLVNGWGGNGLRITEAEFIEVQTEVHEAGIGHSVDRSNLGFVRTYQAGPAADKTAPPEQINS